MIRIKHLEFVQKNSALCELKKMAIIPYLFFYRSSPRTVQQFIMI